MLKALQQHFYCFGFCYILLEYDKTEVGNINKYYSY